MKYMFTHRASGPELRSSRENTTFIPQVSALTPQSAYNRMERVCQRHGSDQTPVLHCYSLTSYITCYLYQIHTYMPIKKVKCKLGPWDSHIRTRTPYCYHLHTETPGLPPDTGTPCYPYLYTGTPWYSSYTSGPHDISTCTLRPHDTPTTPWLLPAHWDPDIPVHAHWEIIIPCTLWWNGILTYTLRLHKTPACVLGPHETATNTLGLHNSPSCTRGSHDSPICTLGPHSPTCTLGPHYSYLTVGELRSTLCTILSVPRRFLDVR